MTSFGGMKLGPVEYNLKINYYTFLMQYEENSIPASLFFLVHAVVLFVYPPTVSWLPFLFLTATFS